MNYIGLEAGILNLFHEEIAIRYEKVKFRTPEDTGLLVPEQMHVDSRIFPKLWEALMKETTNRQRNPLLGKLYRTRKGEKVTTHD